VARRLGEGAAGRLDNEAIKEFRVKLMVTFVLDD
jgi:hypothetical protein